jgi:hypothetical protein
MDELKQTSVFFADMKDLWTDFESNHNEYAKTETKKSAARARKSIQALKALITNYKKASIEECKS